ncbi:OB-fold nucleic acid binding domain-containing protein [Fluviispira sanaruensis]|uniref:Uncharacterized protein n=1 Tax=Fluviispira sanaruensis TaxID=2493639 RepID=A0A4P2VMM9_FLUSA|nr:hypothetical protein [Fluviispira sanaruensis]BBH53304.1 hypothetical protein JCM31447_17470 [Fluviispira sanaruensis]
MKRLLHLSISFLLIINLMGCERRARLVEIKLLLLTPDGYFNQPIVLSGKVNDIGPGGLWFILEDKTGYIQVTTENIPNHNTCIKKGNEVSLGGHLEQYENHKYFSLNTLLRCSH